METLYRKNRNGRYEPAGVHGTPDLSNGIWLVETKEYSKSLKNLVWRLGDVKPFGDIVDDASLVALEDDLATYLNKIQDENSDEFQAIKEKLFGFMNKVPPAIYNVSMSDMAMIIIEFLRKKIISEKI